MNKYPTYAEAEDVILYSYFDPQGLEIKSGLMTGVEWVHFLNELRRKNTPEDCLCATKIYHIEATLDEDGKAIVYESLEEGEVLRNCDTCNRRCRPGQLEECEDYICKLGKGCPNWELRMLDPPERAYIVINGKKELVRDETIPPAVNAKTRGDAQ